MLKIDNTMEIVFATGNRHKVEEAAQILGPEFRLRTPAELGITEDIPETSDTLEGNALQKAEYVYNKTGGCFRPVMPVRGRRLRTMSANCSPN